MKKTKLTPQRKAEVIALAKNVIGNIWSHPNGPRGGREFTDHQCEYCGKNVGGKTNTRYVHILTTGKILPNGVSEEEIEECQDEIGSQSQGAFAIGSECVKKVLGKNVETHSFFYDEK